jgi:predicted HAD superfamily Cof-like phosphohydrolase
MNQFVEDIFRFNEMYDQPRPEVPSTAHLPVVARMTQFKRIIMDEVVEVEDIIAEGGKSELDDLVNLADWLGDLTIYAASEMQRFGIPQEAVLKIIMQSNFSKLGADGLPIVKDGKIQKGPNYWKPEPKLRELFISMGVKE